MTASEEMGRPYRFDAACGFEGTRNHKEKQRHPPALSGDETQSEVTRSGQRHWPIAPEGWERHD